MPASLLCLVSRLGSSKIPHYLTHHRSQWRRALFASAQVGGYSYVGRDAGVSINLARVHMKPCSSLRHLSTVLQFRLLLLGRNPGQGRSMRCCVVLSRLEVPKARLLSSRVNVQAYPCTVQRWIMMSPIPLRLSHLCLSARGLRRCLFAEVDISSR
jgi:hypothetical protein